MRTACVEEPRPPAVGGLPKTPRRPAPGARRGLVGTLLKASMISVVAVALGPLGNAMAAGGVTIESPANGSVISDSTPTLTGTAEAGVVTVTIFAAGGRGGKPQTLRDTVLVGTRWQVTASHLADGTYTAEASEPGAEGESEGTASVTFTVETVLPHVTLTYPASGATSTTGTEPVGGLAGTAEGDAQTVTVQLFSGPTIGAQQALEALTVPVSGGAWSGTFGGLGMGTYTIRAEQSNSH